MEPRILKIDKCEVVINDQLGLLSVTHDGSITWDDLFRIKNAVWGEEVRAIEVYPSKSLLVNSGPYRHLWRLGSHDFCPDLLGADLAHDGLEARHARSWAEARALDRDAITISELDALS